MELEGSSVRVICARFPVSRSGDGVPWRCSSFYRQISFVRLFQTTTKCRCSAVPRRMVSASRVLFFRLPARTAAVQQPQCAAALSRRFSEFASIQTFVCFRKFRGYSHPGNKSGSSDAMRAEQLSQPGKPSVNIPASTQLVCIEEEIAEPQPSACSSR